MIYFTHERRLDYLTGTTRVRKAYEVLMVVISFARRKGPKGDAFNEWISIEKHAVTLWNRDAGRDRIGRIYERAKDTGK